MRKQLILLFCCSYLAACSTLPLDEPRTIGEVNANFDYIPLDPLAINIAFVPELQDTAAGSERMVARYRRCPSRRKNDPADLMDALPDNTVRMGVEELTGEGNLSLGPVSSSGSGRQYRVTADAVITDEVNVDFAVRRSGANGAISVLSAPGRIPPGDRLEVFRIVSPADDVRASSGDFERITIPVYVGVGVRLSAAITHRSGRINLSSLPALTAGVEARRVSGSLSMQSLGVFSQQITSLMQIPNELNSASVQQALVALGSARAVMYDADTGTRPRIVGFANPFRTNDPRLMQMIRSELARVPVQWVPCGSA